MAVLKDSPDIKFHQEDIPADLVAIGYGLTQASIEQKLGELIHSSLETETEISAEKIEAGHWEWKIRIGGEGRFWVLNSRIAYHILHVTRLQQVYESSIQSDKHYTEMTMFKRIEKSYIKH